VACPTVRGYEFDLSTFSDVDPPLGGIGIGIGVARSGGGGGLYLDLASDTARKKKPSSIN